jgi:hypothetical protein
MCRIFKFGIEKKYAQAAISRSGGAMSSRLQHANDLLQNLVKPIS